MLGICRLSGWEAPRPIPAARGEPHFLKDRGSPICGTSPYLREYLWTPSLGLWLVNPRFSRGQALPGYSPDFNADEAIWGWARKEVTGNLCLGTKDLVQERVSGFFAGLSSRKEEVKHHCRTVLQSMADRLVRAAPARFPTLSKCTSHFGFGLSYRAALR